jgi:membrane protein implicated in regulation of membrane protease activity
MYLVVIAWMYVALMMAVAEATSSQGSVLGAVITFVLYGLLPVSLVVYLLLAPARRKMLRAREAAEFAAQQAAASVDQPDGSGHAAADAIAPVREKP